VIVFVYEMRRSKRDFEIETHSTKAIKLSKEKTAKYVTGIFVRYNHEKLNLIFRVKKSQQYFRL